MSKSQSASVARCSVVCVAAMWPYVNYFHHLFMPSYYPGNSAKTLRKYDHVTVFQEMHLQYNMVAQWRETLDI